MFKENVQGRKHPGNCAFAETGLLRHRTPKRLVQNENNGHKNPIIVTIVMMKIVVRQNIITEIDIENPGL